MDIQPFELEADVSVWKAVHIGALLLGLCPQIIIERPLGVLNGSWIQGHEL